VKFHMDQKIPKENTRGRPRDTNKAAVAQYILQKVMFRRGRGEGTSRTKMQNRNRRKLKEKEGAGGDMETLLLGRELKRTGLPIRYSRESQTELNSGGKNEEAFAAKFIQEKAKGKTREMYFARIHTQRRRRLVLTT